MYILRESSIQPIASSIAPEVPDSLGQFRLNRKQQALRDALHLLNRVSPAAAAHLAIFLFLRPRRKSVNYLEQLPEGAARIEIVHNLKKLVGYSWGTGDKTILLIHGWESHLGRMLPLVMPLVEAGFRVVALDSPGHGQSPQLLTNMYDVGEAVLSTIEQLGSVYAIVANSFGAAATMTMLTRHQEMQPEKVVLVSPMGHINQHIDIFNRIVGIDVRLGENMRRVLQSKLPLPLEKFDVAEAAANVRSAGMIIHDQHDLVIPLQSSRRIADTWGGADANVGFLTTAQLGHKNVLRKHVVHQAIVAFLQS
jgi:pimeloyl-ACP methyl ester carboxylesterase